ncbi:shikimate dehydrogenase [Pseudonocardia sp. WMMC193]|uniref:shikimate dehydrogenase family protein n=1 Tax=Pseudonocardia sp. WMMC193 TaxID=2911965 RepID=UPI001F1CF573|nr:hypothetical protein [Pseudonocardia sp. WMMC193]MCF7550667.1 hypothetical protein [Pseudonocardia sp. WMMC193]
MGHTGRYPEVTSPLTSPLPTGRTRTLGIIGDPVHHVESPRLWGEQFAATGVDALCMPIEVGADDLALFLDAARRWRNLIGLIVTMPHKVAAYSLAHRTTERARRIGAVNVLRVDPRDSCWVADMVDGVGFLDAFEQAVGPVRGRRVLVVGAGGAGTAIAFALGDAGVATCDIADVDGGRSDALVAGLRADGVDSRSTAPRGRGYDILINATPSGMRPTDPLPIDLAGVTRATAVADIINRAGGTRLLDAAGAIGCTLFRGRQMSQGQIAAQGEFFGILPPVGAARGSGAPVPGGSQANPPWDTKVC